MTNTLLIVPVFNRMTGPDCAVMFIFSRTHAHRLQEPDRSLQRNASTSSSFFLALRFRTPPHYLPPLFCIHSGGNILVGQIACLADDVRPGLTTHRELDPTNMLSLVASLTPFSDYNQSPRNMYQVRSNIRGNTVNNTKSAGAKRKRRNGTKQH